MTYDDQARDFYKRLADAIEDPRARRIYLEQLSNARIDSLDPGHDEFHVPSETPRIGESIEVIDAIYRDEDGARVNVIVHFSGGAISWAERYRDLGEPIIRWPPSPGIALEFPHY